MLMFIKSILNFSFTEPAGIEGSRNPMQKSVVVFCSLSILDSFDHLFIISLKSTTLLCC